MKMEISENCLAQLQLVLKVLINHDNDPSGKEENINKLKSKYIPHGMSKSNDQIK